MDWTKVDTAVNTAGEVYSTTARIGRGLIGLFFAVVGAGLLAWGVMWLSDRISSIDEYVLTSGTVKELDKDKDHDGGDGYVYAPIISYTDNSGKEYLYKSSNYSYPPDYDIGDKVEIYYLPSSPKEAFINTFTEKWLVGIIIVFVGLVLLPLGVWVGISAFKKDKIILTQNISGSSDTSGYGNTGVRIG